MPIPNQIISAGIGPIIVISACGLLSSAFFTRITNVISRLRVMQRERLAEQTLIDRETDPIVRSKREDMLQILSEQTESLIYRIRLIRRTLFSLLSTIACMVLCSLCLGLSAIPAAGWLTVPAVVFFIAGLTILLCAIGFAMADLRIAIDPVVTEARWVTKRVRIADKA